MLYENDLTHRGILVLEKGDWPAEGYMMHLAKVFSRGNATQVLDAVNPSAVMTPIPMIWEGVVHIWKASITFSFCWCWCWRCQLC